jgi:hypothetical protein
MCTVQSKLHLINNDYKYGVINTSELNTDLEWSLPNCDSVVEAGKLML